MESLNKSVRIDSGPHKRNHCPIIIPCPGMDLPEFGLLVNDKRELPFQRVAKEAVAVILDDFAANSSEPLEMWTAANSHFQLPAMSIESSADGQLSILSGTELVTCYNFGSELARPYFYPVNAPGELCVTRSYPMTDVTGETKDHPHHKSMWIAYGDVNGTDNWSEESGHGRTVHTDINRKSAGIVLAQFSASGIWQSSTGSALLSEHINVSAWHGTSTSNILDIEIELTADQSGEDIRFGDTKEGGILSVRVATPIDANKGGRFTNVYGGVNERECWGKPSQWCSYSGKIDGNDCGIAVFESPLSFRSPTTWHARDYGLMTANPFGYGAFTGGRLDGSHLLKAGASLHFSYRVIVHTTSDYTQLCQNQFLDYAFPPTATLL